MKFNTWLFLNKYGFGLFTKNVKEVTIPKSQLYDKVKCKYVFPNSKTLQIVFKALEKD